MFLPIAEDEVTNTHFSVVNGHLVEHLLRESHVWSFELNQANGLHASVVYDSIASFLHLPHFDGCFHGDETLWVAEVFYQGVKKVLPDPFLRREAHKFLAPHAEDVVFAPDGFYLWLVGHFFQLSLRLAVRLKTRCSAVVSGSTTK